MLRKAKETKLRLIQENNRRLMNKQQKGIDEVDVMGAKKIITTAHKKMIEDLGNFLENKLDKVKLNGVRQQINDHEEDLIQYVIDRLGEGGLG